MRKLIVSLFFFLFVSVSMLVCSVFAAEAEDDLEIGTSIGNVLSTDIKASINNQPIKSFNINGDTVIHVNELSNFGFDINWNNDDRTITIQRNTSKTITDRTIEGEANETVIGEKINDVLYTDIATYIGNRKIPSFNIDGSTVIYLNDLALFGSIVWKQDQRTINLDLNNVTLPQEPISVRVSNNQKKVTFVNNTKNNIVSIYFIDLYLNLKTGKPYIYKINYTYDSVFAPNTTKQESRFGKSKDYLYLGSAIQEYAYKDNKVHYAKNELLDFEVEYIISERSINQHITIAMAILEKKIKNLDNRIAELENDIKNKEEQSNKIDEEIEKEEEPIKN